MARKKQASFKMKGHTLPGVNQKSETVNVTDGRSPSSAFQQNYDNMANKEASPAKKYKSAPMKNYKKGYYGA